MNPKQLSLIFITFFPLFLFSQIHPENIQIVRDSFGVPHIFAPTDNEVIYGFAWAQSEDDFETIQQRLCMGKGMMGKIWGKKGAKMDYVRYLLRIEDFVENQYASMIPEEGKQHLAAFTQGVNDYAARHPEEVLVRGLFPVTPQDFEKGYCMTYCFMLGLDKQLKRIYGGFMDSNPEFLRKKQSFASTAGVPDAEFTGSNAFALQRKKMNDDKTTLICNPHQPLEGLFSFYEAHLVSEEGLNVIGATFPGAYAIFMGTNEHLGWAHTTNECDFIDIYQLTINPENKNQYRFDGKWETLESRKPKLRLSIKGIPVTKKKETLWSKYGATIRTKEGVFAVRLSANQTMGFIEEWFQMDKARNYNEFMKALEMQRISNQHIIYADDQDNIFFLNNGLFPKRNPGYDWKKVLPGDTSATLWTEYLPLSALPFIKNPESGYLFNTNNTSFHTTDNAQNLKAEQFSPTMGLKENDNPRGTRAGMLLSGAGKTDMETLKKIKYDVSYPDSIVWTIDVQGFMRLNAEKYPDIADAIAKVKCWNHCGNLENKEVTIFMLAWDYLYYNWVDKYALTAGTVLSENCYAEALRHAKKHLLKHFGTIDIPLEKVQYHIRGDKKIAMDGLPELLRQGKSMPYKKGIRRMTVGETYIAFVRYGENGVEYESVVPYGSSNKPGSPHYTDQMELYVNKQTKKGSLSRAIFQDKRFSKYAPR